MELPAAPVAQKPSLIGTILRVTLGILFVLTIYLLPLGVGMLRRVRNVGSVAAIDVLLGWTLVGWAIALAMSVRSKS